MQVVVNRLGGGADFAAAIKTLLTTVGTKAGLFKNDIIPTPDTVLGVGGLVDANFDGYAQKAALHSVGPFFDPNLNFEIQSPSITWTPTAGVTPNTIYGMYVIDSTGALVYSCRFTNPVLLSGILTGITVVPRFAVPSFGWPTIIEPDAA
jgi:hypothetical protein